MPTFKAVIPFDCNPLNTLHLYCCLCGVEAMSVLIVLIMQHMHCICTQQNTLLEKKRVKAQCWHPTTQTTSQRLWSGTYDNGQATPTILTANSELKGASGCLSVTLSINCKAAERSCYLQQRVLQKMYSYIMIHKSNNIAVVVILREMFQ